MKKMWKKLQEELALERMPGRTTYYVLFVILILAAYVRVWRTDKILGFYYDQGRDAQVIWDFLHRGKLFLIGPTTGIEGIFRGPWYYWLITPFYWLGRGDPVWPAVFLALTTVLALFVLFHLTYQISGKTGAFTALIIGSFSFFFVVAARWLSNPTPMFLISMLLLYSMFLVIRGRKWAWVAIGFLLGLSMQFGSATEVFLFPAVLVFAMWQRRNLPNLRIFLLSAFLLSVTFIPQIWFDLKHEGILRQSVGKFLLGEQSFKLSFWDVLRIRSKFYLDVFGSKLFPTTGEYRNITALFLGAVFLLTATKLLKNKYFLAALLVFTSPLAGMIFFQGNHGNVYDYYFTGYYFVFVLVLASVCGLVARAWWGKIILVIFIYFFLRDNLPVMKSYISDNIDGPNTIAFGNQKQALDWIYQDMGGCQKFNDDEYVPPVIPHAYKYLFTWYGGRVKSCAPVEQRENLLYTLYEVDPPHPERLDAWLARQEGIGKVEKSARFGGITVERRLRINE
ncbi:MAG: hypothetical protein A2782_02735 [Candidatus Blackburnbacteria bacterium RIFCSPHIGHO2_01_FULL_43_15b]|uniref:Glycosyltransferase RgtA/B/C/D-like domain-containing protein n=1 Tax=Candidatus Blackburnbacteria bacterium RIFCSPHIGHO2_01_FULL_43_15b TaxID=1797513 RepID=A0A1G1V2W4_9BACT|nr:MAG: hypothetical protein A2782_02735 [Candidatus Blackburnbacteria bacterium RIFCSPHIGHO2_01_FULL_43_15b]